MTCPTLSILIPSHNRLNVIERVWASWMKQDGLIDVVLVNDGSSQDYAKLHNSIGEACAAQGIRFHLINLPARRGAPAARNRGILECLGEEILTVDDDIILADDLVRTCRLFRPSGKSVVTGPKVIYLRDGETTTQAIERTKPDASLPYMDMGRLLLTPWAGDGKAIRVPFITSIALWPRDLFQKGLRYFEGYEGNGFREETDPQVQAQMRYEASVYLIPASFCFHLPLALAYADGGGQRRHGILWYEYWAIRNNAVFWMRNRKFLEEQWNVCSLRSQMKFVWHRLHVRRLINLLKNNS